MDMRKMGLLLVAAFLTLVIISCNFTAAADEPEPAVTVIIEPTSVSPQNNKTPLSEADIPRVSLEEALAALQSGAAVVVDVRSPEAYAASHIAGAISIPLGEIETDPTGLDLDQDQWIITYCT